MKASLYYDASCPLCSKEISLLKRLSKGRILFINIHSLDDDSLPCKVSMLKRLHLRKASGEWLIGLDANAYAWCQTPYGLFFKVLRVWPVSVIADAVYRCWADRRFKKRYQCGRCVK